MNTTSPCLSSSNPKCDILSCTPTTDFPSLFTTSTAGTPAFTNSSSNLLLVDGGQLPGRNQTRQKRLRRSFPVSKPTSGREVVATENTPPSTSKPKRKTFTCTLSSVFPIALAASRMETPDFKSSPTSSLYQLSNAFF